MKTLLIITMSLLPCLSFAETAKCVDQKVTIIGKYGAKGENSTPLLDSWSEVSGNLTSFEVRAKEAFTKAIIVLKDSENIVLAKSEVSVKKNQSSVFDLVSEIKKQKATVKKMELELYAGNTKDAFCLEDSSIITPDEQDGKEVKNEKNI